MSLHPTITAALADQHRRDLMSQASAYRLARTARQGSSSSPARRPQIVRTLRTAAVASAIAATAFLVTPAGPSHAPSAHGNWYVHFAGESNAPSANGKWYAQVAGHNNAPSANGKWSMHFVAHSNSATVHNWSTVSQSSALMHHSPANIRFTANPTDRWA